MGDGQQTELEALREQAAQSKEAVKAYEALETQRTVLRPQLVKREAVLERKVQPLELELKRVIRALQDIDDGILTDYRLRKKAVRKPKAAPKSAEGEV